MRVKLFNKTKYDTRELAAITQWVSSFFPHVTGPWEVILRKAKRGTHHGWCHYMRRRIRCFIAFDMGLFPETVTERLYFKHASGKPTPYTLKDWRESFIHLLAHEMQHGTKSNRRMRRSVQELNSENKATEVLGAWRAYGQRETYDLLDKESAVMGDVPQTQDQADDKVLRLLERKSTWESKAKRAATALKKINRSLKYYEAKKAASGR